MQKVFVFTILLIVILSVSLYAQSGREDVVYLKNGSVVRGTILEQIPNQTLKIRTKDGSEFIYKFTEISKITKEAIKGSQATPAAGRIEGYKSPGTALALSVLICGLGQHYSGNYLQGIIHEVIFVGGIVMPFLFWDSVEDETQLALYIAGFGLAGISWIWSVVDAPFSAARHNRRLARQYGHLFQLGNEHVVIGLAPAVFNRGLGTRLTVHF